MKDYPGSPENEEGNKIQAIKLLGISRSALIYRMEKYKIKTISHRGTARRSTKEHPLLPSPRGEG
jgi:hypothetical protein